MDNSRLKYYATDDCIKRVAEKYIDDYAMDLDAICKKKSNKTFLIMERDSEKQNPITLATLEKHSNNFYCIELISPFNILLIQTRIFLHASQEVIPSVFPQNIKGEWIQGKTPLKIVNDALSAQYLGYKISCLTLMIMTLECFVNENIPNDIDKGLDGKEQKIDKEYIERRWDLKQKMLEIGNINKIYNPQYQSLISDIIPLQKLRNEFVHLKSDKPNPFDDPCVDCYEKLFSTDLALSFNKIIEYIKLVKPDIVLD